MFLLNMHFVAAISSHWTAVPRLGWAAAVSNAAYAFQMEEVALTRVVDNATGSKAIGSISAALVHNQLKAIDSTCVDWSPLQTSRNCFMK